MTKINLFQGLVYLIEGFGGDEEAHISKSDVIELLKTPAIKQALERINVQSKEIDLELE